MARERSHCGVSISQLVEIENISGYRTIYHFDDTDDTDYGDEEITDSDHERFECPECGARIRLAGEAPRDWFNYGEGASVEAGNLNIWTNAQ